MTSLFYVVLCSNRVFYCVVSFIKDVRVIILKVGHKLKGYFFFQLLQEKYDIQHVLLEYEHMFGHPVSEEERLLTKTIYDRYRFVKRQFRKSNSVRHKYYFSPLLHLLLYFSGVNKIDLIF